MQSTLFSPIQLNGLVLKNRIVMAPMGVCLASDTGAASSQLIDFYRDRARGGAGLILVGGGQATERRPPGLLALDDDQMIPGLNDLVEGVQQEGARIGIQLNVSDHFLPDPLKRTPDNVSREEIENIIQCFVRAAARAKEAGFDLVEFHGAHGYLVSQFFSPLSNHRCDPYGGNAERRCAFALEILRQARNAVGSTFPLVFRINGSDFMEGGTDIDEAIANAKLLEAGGVNALDISGGRRPFSDHYTMQPMGQPSGGLVTLAAAIKREVRVPVLTAGKIDAALAERIIREGKADLVSMGRGLIADPDLPAKAREGRTAEIRPCLYCNYCISQRTRQKRRVRCTVNAAAGREREFKISPAAKKREVVVIGGGPAGLECAKVLRIRGHEVTLLEKRDRLGGQGWLASLPPGKEAIMGFISLLDREVRQLGVRVECSREIGPKEIDKLKADAVVLASGSSPVLPDIPGTKNANVTTGFSVLENGGQGLGKRIAVIGGGDVGCEVAEYLAHQGKTVTLIEQLEAVGLLLEPYTRRFFMERLSRCAIEVRLNQRVTSLQGSQVHCVDPRGGTSCIECDHVVMCVGTRANRALLPAIAAHFQEVYAIGDCMNPKNIFQAVSDGGRIGRRI